MKTFSFCRYFFIMTICMIITSCADEYELPDHKLDVEFNYELTCSEQLLKYVIPRVTITDETGYSTTLTIEKNMWTGGNHKTWTQSIHYDSLKVSNKMTVEYLPISGVMFQDEENFDETHHLSCRISVLEDNDGRRNKFNIIPDFTSNTAVKADVLEAYVQTLSKKTITRGGSVGEDGEIIEIYIDK